MLFGHLRLLRDGMSLGMLLFNFCWSTILKGKINVHGEDLKPSLCSVWFVPLGSSVIPEVAGLFWAEPRCVPVPVPVPGAQGGSCGGTLAVERALRPWAAQVGAVCPQESTWLSPSALRAGKAPLRHIWAGLEAPSRGMSCFPGAGRGREHGEPCAGHQEGADPYVSIGTRRGNLMGDRAVNSLQALSRTGRERKKGIDSCQKNKIQQQEHLISWLLRVFWTHLRSIQKLPV